MHNFVNKYAIVLSVMSIYQWLKSSEKLFHSANIPTARLDAELLLAHELRVNRSYLHTHLDTPLQRQSLQRLERMILRRVAHEPIAYILGRQEFYGREFIVSPDTLTPRPETETMIELLLKAANGIQFGQVENLEIIDVGTGSGCIVITAALELTKISDLPSSTFYTGLDISDKALEIARKNALKLGVRIDFRTFDITKEALRIHSYKTTRIVLANLPYIPNYFHINLAASHEPPFAIYGGKDGLDYYRSLFEGVSTADVVLTESLPPQHPMLQSIAEKHGFRQHEESDFIQVFSAKK